MAGFLGNLQRAEFDYIPFMSSGFDVRGGARVHVHEYRHTPGGVIEKLGRRLYMIDFNAVFSTETRSYPDAFPNNFSDLIDRFDRLVTSSLVIPILGTIQAMCVDWPINVDYQKMRDGVKVRLSFMEDQNQALIANNVIQPAPSFLAPSADLLAGAIEDLALDPTPFKSIAQICDELDAIAQDAENMGQMYVDQLSELIDSGQQLHERVESLKQPQNWPAAKALRSLVVQGIKTKANLLRKLTPIVTYPITKPTTVVLLAIELYGDAARASEIMMLNSFENPMLIQPGKPKEIRIYQPSVLRAA